MTDHGSQPCTNEEAQERGVNMSGRELAGLGIRQVLAGVGHPQANGKLERPRGEIQRKLRVRGDGGGEEPARPACSWSGTATSGPTCRWIGRGRRHPRRRSRGRCPSREIVTDRQTGEEYNATWGGGANYFLDPIT